MTDPNAPRTGPDARSSGLWAELKRRRVVRVSAAYALVAWIVIEAADVLVPALRLPEWAISLVALFVVLGFPAAVVLAWAFEITPDGVKRTADVSPDAGLDPDPEDARSIAILPFDNLSADEDNAYFAAGMHEEVLTQLSKIQDLRVVSRTSVLPYAETDKSMRVIGRELGVRAVVEGGVQRVRDQVRVTAQLIDARTDEYLWADRYDRRLEDVFAIQSEIALAIAGALEATLAPDERERIEKRPTENMAAYDLYLRGLELYLQGREENETAIELFKQAVALDPRFAGAHAMIANGYMQRVQTYGFPMQWADSGTAVARRAIELDPDLSIGHKALASNLYQLGRITEGREAHERALELDPNSQSALIGLSWNAATVGRYDESIHWATRAMPLDPRSPFPLVHIAYDRGMLGQYEEAERSVTKAEELSPDLPWAPLGRVLLAIATGRDDAAVEYGRRVVERDPGGFMSRVVAAFATLRTGRYEEAASHYERLVQMLPDGRHIGTLYSFRLGLAFALSRTGDAARAAELFDTALARARAEIERGNEDPNQPLEIAAIHAVRGEHDEAYRWLDRAYDAGLRAVVLIDGDPLFERLHGEERFRRFIERMRADVSAMRARAVALSAP